MPPAINPSYTILNLLSKICDVLHSPYDPSCQSEEYRNQLKALEQEIQAVPTTLDLDDSDSKLSTAVRLYQIASQIYLVRASQNHWETPTRIDDLIDAAFEGPVKSCTCPHFFPLFIVACEARTDEQRVAILNMIDRVKRDGRIRTVEGVKRSIQAIWIQQDLNADNDLLLDYADIMSATISSSGSIPSFV